MSYSPAYHNAKPPLDTSPISSRPIRASLERPEPSHPSPIRPSAWTTRDVSPRTSGPRGSHISSGASRRESAVGDEAVTPVLVTNGSTHKEGRSPGSWADQQPSLMSGEHSRSNQRAVPEAVTEGGQDAVLMLVGSIYTFSPYELWSIQCRSLVLTPRVVPTISPCPTLLLRRLCIHFLRNHLCHPNLALTTLLNLSIPPQNIIPNPTMRSPFSRPPHPRTARLHAATHIQSLLLYAVDPR